MWIVAMFDLPVDSPRARRAYTQFRKKLLDDGFSMLQYSVYARHCATEENTAVHFQRVRQALPDDGEVRLVCITDRQFGKMETFTGKKRQPTPDSPKQLELF
jgi:CRISPR-associated protein Cas2